VTCQLADGSSQELTAGSPPPSRERVTGLSSAWLAKPSAARKHSQACDQIRNSAPIDLFRTADIILIKPDIYFAG
jgi:hypothetical protein